jgi:hypothetical protein
VTAFRHSPRLAFWTLAALTLLVSHDAVWLVQRGPGEDVAAALRTAQHGYWAWASIGIVGVAVLVVAATALRATALVRRARRLRADVAPVGLRSFGTRFAVAWVRLVAVVAIGFAVQENVEHFVAHGHLLGLGAITGPEYPLAVPILVGLGAVAALVIATVRCVERELLRAIATAERAGRSRAPRVVRWATRPARRPRLAPLAGMDAGRAPPPLLVTG